MGGLTPFLSAAMPLATSALSGWQQSGASRQAEQLMQQQNLVADQLRAQQALEMQAAGAEAQNRLAALSQQAAADERGRRDALRAGQGRTRAELAGRGFSAADGSGAAILRGLLDDSEQERRSSVQLDQLKRQAIQQELDTARRRNLLEQAQLAQRQRLDLLSRYY